jgi:outer membrane protein assembly factor BamD (BamD/ComL family)
MSSLLYLLLFIVPVLLGLAIVCLTLVKKNSHSELYSEGLRNENEGRYNLALHNYETALGETRKLNSSGKFTGKLAQRIKILRATIDYEKNFQSGRDL